MTAPLPVIPSLSRLATKGDEAPLRIPVFDRARLSQRLSLSQLVSEEARTVLAKAATDSERIEQRMSLTVEQLASELARQVLAETFATHPRVAAADLSEQLRSLMSCGRIGAARALLAAGVAGGSLNATAPVWTAILEPPTTRVQPKSGTGNFRLNAEWLRSHRSSFLGKWVALAAGQLIDHDPSRLSLHQRLELAGKLVKGTLITKVT